MLHIETLGQGPDVVFLHGWSLHGGIWQRVVQSQPNMSCHVYDETGYGVAFAIRMR